MVLWASTVASMKSLISKSWDQGHYPAVKKVMMNGAILGTRRAGILPEEHL